MSDYEYEFNISRSLKFYHIKPIYLSIYKFKPTESLGF